MDSIPFEIIHLILNPNLYDYTDQSSLVEATNPLKPNSKEYLRLRLVGKRFCTIVTSYSFKHLRISSQKCSLSGLQSIAQSQSLNRFVKEYTYHLEQNDLRTPDGNSVAEIYYRLTSIPESDQKRALARMSAAERMCCEEYDKQIEFGQSHELYKIHKNSLSTLPNLRSISITVSDYATLSAVPQAHPWSFSSPWGPEVFRSILEVLYQRTQRDVSPIEGLLIEGITQECMYLSRKDMTKALSGFRFLKCVSFTLFVGRSRLEPETWVSTVGRFLQAIELLEDLLIGTAIPEQGDDFMRQADIYLRALIMPRDFEGAQKLPIHHWPKLKAIELQDNLFTGKLFLGFIERHKATIERITLFRCDLRPQKGDPKTSDMELVNPRDWPPERALTMRLEPMEEWSHIFRTLKSYEIPLSLKLSLLSEGRSGHDHMNLEEMEAWENWVSGKTDDEPEEGSWGIGGEWCDLCVERSFDILLRDDEEVDPA